PGTALPGQRGNVGVAGHRDTVFRPLRHVRRGDLVALTTPHGTFDYRVAWTRIVSPADVAVLQPTHRPSLTLVTCYPFYFVGHAPRRFVVRAVAADPAGSH
ncbi:MAG TPA: class D sortase, partial [Vicinamibacterales bacterium]|nr:class D sortase [Vicinamibacterales bacterium]